MEDRLTALIRAAEKSGLSLDLLYDLTAGLDRQAFLKVMGNASSSPIYRKSSDKP